MKKFAVVFLTLFLMIGLYAGIQETQTQTEPEDAWIITLPPVTMDTSVLEHNFNNNSMTRFAEALPVTFDMCNYGKWTELEDGSREWEMKIVSPGAVSLQVQFNHLYLPKGSDLSILDENDKLAELLLGDDQSANTMVMSGLYRGEKITLKYREQENTNEVVDLKIGKIMQGYRDVFTMPRGYKTAGLVIVDGTHVGYGLLVNNKEKDFKPYFLTSLNYIDADGQLEDAEMKAVNNWQFCFRSQQAMEDNTYSWVTYQGGTLKSIQTKSGYALVEMTEAPFKKNTKVIFHGWSDENKPEEHAARLETSSLRVAGLPRLSANNVITENIFDRSEWQPAVPSNVAKVSGAGIPKDIILDDPVESLSSPYISPNVSRVACTPVTFTANIGPLPYTFTWYPSSNLEVIGGSNSRTYTVRAKNNASGSGYVHCRITDGSYLIADLWEYFTVEGFRVWITNNTSDLLINNQRTYCAYSPSDCPIDNYDWAISSNLEYVGVSTGNCITVKGKTAGPADVSFSGSNNYGDADLDTKPFNVIAQLPCNDVVIRGFLRSSITSCNQDMLVGARAIYATYYQWEVNPFEGRIVSGQGTNQIEVDVYCFSPTLTVTLTASNKCSSDTYSEAIPLPGYDDGGFEFE